jgi:hypothetical protein
MTSRIERDYLRIAEAEGIERPRIEKGDPHSRLIGSCNGQRLSLVISLSTGTSRDPRFYRTVKTNFRRAVRSLAPPQPQATE